MSSEMNHCAVARKITGLWQRQQCGYECSYSCTRQSAPLACRSSTICLLAFQMCMPA